MWSFLLHPPMGCSAHLCNAKFGVKTVLSLSVISVCQRFGAASEITTSIISSGELVILLTCCEGDIPGPASSSKFNASCDKVRGAAKKPMGYRAWTIWEDQPKDTGLCVHAHPQFSNLKIVVCRFQSSMGIVVAEPHSTQHFCQGHPQLLCTTIGNHIGFSRTVWVFVIIYQCDWLKFMVQHPLDGRFL